MPPYAKYAVVERRDLSSRDVVYLGAYEPLFGEIERESGYVAKWIWCRSM